MHIVEKDPTYIVSEKEPKFMFSGAIPESTEFSHYITGTGSDDRSKTLL